MGCYGYSRLASASGAKEYYNDHIDDYDTYKEENWQDYLDDMVGGFAKSLPTPFTMLFSMLIKDVLTKYDGDDDAVELSEWLVEYSATQSEGFGRDIVNFSEYLEDYTVLDEEEWITSEYEGALGDIADACYEDYKDRKMGLDKD